MTTAQAKAARIDAERERIVRAAARQAAGVQLRIRAEALRVWRKGGGVSGVASAIRERFADLTPTVRESMLAGHLAGELGSVRNAAQAPQALSLARPLETAADYFAKRLGLSTARLREITDRYGTAAASATEDAATILETKVVRALAENTLAGGHLRAGTDAIRQAFDAAGVTPANDYTIENIVRTQTAIAYSAGRSVRDADPDIQEILWGYEWVTFGDDRVRPTHAAMDGYRAPKEDPIWQVWDDPAGWGCRCKKVAIFYGDAEAEASGPIEPVEVDGQIVVPRPDEGWGWSKIGLYNGLVTGV